MTMRILCAAVIIIGFGYGGIMLSEIFKNRIRSLSGFCDGLSQLEFNIRYMNFPLCEAFSRSGSTLSGVVREVFEDTSALMIQKRESPPGEAFCRSIENKMRELRITRDEQEILESFSKGMGEGDREKEISNIKTAIVRLSAAKSDAEDDVLKKVKLCKKAGFLIGAFAVIALF